MRTRILYTGGMSASPRAPQKASGRKRCACGCGKLFTPKRAWQKFYSPQCKDNYHNLGPAFGKLEHRGLERLVKLALEQVKGKLPTLVKAHLPAMLLVKEQERVIENLILKTDLLAAHQKTLQERIEKLENDRAR